jgi:hypothetical protein
VETVQQFLQEKIMLHDKEADLINNEIDSATTGGFLTDEQRDFAIARLYDLVGRAVRAFKKANPLPYDTRPRLSTDDMLKQIQSGTANLIDVSKLKHSCQLPQGDTTLWTAMFNFQDTADQVEYDNVVALRANFVDGLDARREEAVAQLWLGKRGDAIDILAAFAQPAAAPAPAKK